VTCDVGCVPHIVSAGDLDKALVPQPDHKQMALPRDQAFLVAKSTAQVTQMLLQLAAQEQAADESGEDGGLFRQRYLAWLSKPYPLDSRKEPSRQRPTRSTFNAPYWQSQDWLVHAPSSMLAAAAPIAEKQLHEYWQRIYSHSFTSDSWEASGGVKDLSSLVTRATRTPVD
jgi:hypothetical protein